MSRSAAPIDISLYWADGPNKKRGDDNEPIFINVTIGRESVRSMIDTGASDCFVSQKFRYNMRQEEVQEVVKDVRKKI